METLKGRILEAVTIGGHISDTVRVTGALSVPDIIYPAAYQGEYNVTPSQQSQTLHTANYYLNGDITIDPIPSNYGLITWNGSILTVS